MAATAEQIAELRRRTNEPDDSNGYTDALLTQYVESYPCLDERGEEPYSWDASTEPPTRVANESWIPTYDLAAAAADVWSEKAAVLAQDYDFSADGGRYSRSQAFEAAMKQARYWGSRRRAGTIKLVMHPRPAGAKDLDWIANN